jgi:acyl carrier protein
MIEQQGRPSHSDDLLQGVARVWSEALGVEQASLDPTTSDFFELGGHSLLAMQVVSHILELFQSDLPEDTLDVETDLLYAIFDTPTMAELTECLRRWSSTGQPSST